MMRIEAVELLMAYKEVFLYEELSERLGIHSSMLCRYSQGLTIPSEYNTRKIINTLLSKDSVKEFLYRCLSKYDWNLTKVLSNHKILNVISLYISNTILNNLAGSGLKLLITLPGTSALVTSLTATKLGLPIALIPYSDIRSSGDIIEVRDEGFLRKGDYVAVISDILTTDNLNNITNFLRKYELILKCLIAVLLVDKSIENYVDKITLFDYLIP
ncbi:MAG: hypothetical protein QXZ10_01405 [Sulfolobales archaeon]